MAGPAYWQNLPAAAYRRLDGSNLDPAAALRAVAGLRALESPMKPVSALSSEPPSEPRRGPIDLKPDQRSPRSQEGVQWEPWGPDFVKRRGPRGFEIGINPHGTFAEKFDVVFDHDWTAGQSLSLSDWEIEKPAIYLDDLPTSPDDLVRYRVAERGRLRRRR